ncbi:hypothetical protein HAX54_010828 [Datura stramonium]|uniref:Uncharacterized protein n=1 Tax=Datura stramonium TaxID=4076 RepID=A0ABS8TJL2_DATST|nr:hypothetical protein [Datura stramonium]
MLRCLSCSESGKRNGDTYAGEYFADKMHGFGVYHFGNGHCYEGAWHEGKRQGLGIYTFRNGENQCGHWKNGILNVSSSPYPSGISLQQSTILKCFMQSRIFLYCSPEARQAAEKAINADEVG